MDNLPKSTYLPIDSLSSCFNDITNSYKFYWFLSILDYMRVNQTQVIPIKNLLAMMVASVWFPTRYFRLSFGKQDRLGQIAIKIGEATGLSINSKRNEVIQATLVYIDSNTPLARELMSLGQYVPFRFIRPFFAQELRGIADWKINNKVQELASLSYTLDKAPTIYRLISHPIESIEIHPDWSDYLFRHMTILTEFCLWNLVKYIQKNNPNVPNILNKLFEPEQRDLHLAREYWRLVFEKEGKLNCIYSNQPMQKGGFSLDHFLPWRFVAHDLLWNIVPTPKKINSSKSDNLPDLDRYFESFAHMQFKAIQIVSQASKPNLLEDYILLLGLSSITQLHNITLKYFLEKMYDNIAPQFQIATNMGFSRNWIYV